MKLGASDGENLQLIGRGLIYMSELSPSCQAESGSFQLTDGETLEKALLVTVGKPVTIRIKRNRNITSLVN